MHRSGTPWRSIAAVAMAALVSQADSTGSAAVRGAEISVANRSQLLTALQSAQPGDRILLAAAGDYGPIHVTGLQGVTLTSQNPTQWAALDAGGAGEALHLTSASQVTLERLVLRNFSDNGLNIDDGGNWPAGKSDQITLRDLRIENETAPVGNHDGLKLSGVDHLLVDRVQIRNWGTDGSAIDPVGVHFARIQNSIFTHDSLVGGSGIRPKGGSKDVEIFGNRLELNAGRALQAGGSTGASFFRFVPGDSNYEADQITFAGNLVLGGESAVSWVNINGGLYAHNLFENPSTWVMRMLNENVGTPLVSTQQGRFEHNLVVYGNQLARVSNHTGPGVLEQTFHFTGNQWFNADTGGPASAAELELPAPETGGIYGVDPGVDSSRALAFSMSWGQWIVNPRPSADLITVADPLDYWLATPLSTGQFDPLRDLPLGCDWVLAPLADGSPVSVDALAQQILLRRSDFPWLSAGAVCLLPGDGDGDRQVGAADYAIWAAQFGQTAPTLAGDYNHDGSVGAADYAIWAANFGKSCPPLSSAAAGTLGVPEPSSGVLALGGMAALALVRRGGRRRSRPVHRSAVP